MPFMFAAVRYAFSVGWKGLVIAEVFGSDVGMGWTIKYFYDAHRTQGVIGYGLFFVIFALILERLVFEPLAKRAFKWRPQVGVGDIVEEVAVLQEFEESLEYDRTGEKAGSEYIRKGGNIDG
jgi:NitT/TauT family transport system permease protein